MKPKEEKEAFLYQHMNFAQPVPVTTLYRSRQRGLPQERFPATIDVVVWLLHSQSVHVE